MKKIAFVTAGGSGGRMHKDTPKQFLELQGMPVIIHTLLKFEQSNDIDVIIVVCLNGWIDKLKALALKYNITKLEAIVEGGSNSQESISKGIGYLLGNGYSEDDIVLVHESVRPFITDKIIADNITSCMERGNAVTVVRGNESYLYSEDGISSERHFLREKMFMVQTPQTFRCGEIKRAYEQPYRPTFTDDASVYEAAGYSPRLVEGNRENLKITLPVDLALAEILLSR